jgi:uncharacterized protein YkwD
MKRFIVTSVCTLGLTLLCAFGINLNSSNGLNANKNIAKAMQNIQDPQESTANSNAIPVVTYATQDKATNKPVLTQVSTKSQAVKGNKKATVVKKAKKDKANKNVTVLSYGNVDLSKCKSATELVQKLRENGYNNITLSNINDIPALKNILTKIQKDCPQPTEKPAVTATPAPTKKPAATATPAPTKKPAATATPTPTTKPATNSDLSAYAEQVLKIVNQERAKEGLSALTTNSTLTAAANKRAQEIVQSFSHTRPNGTSFSTVLKEFGVSYKSAGENIAYGQKTPQEVMNGWMNSSGHRANILNSSYNKVGIGVYKANGVIYWTQVFTN